jgi:hypothetical protein
MNLHECLPAILTSLVASLVYGGIALATRGVVKWRRAKSFIGTYAMQTENTTPTGGRVVIEYTLFDWPTFLNSVPSLRVVAEHGTGRRPGTEDGTGQVEVLGFSNIAVGFYGYRNRSGGALRLHLARELATITAFGFPNLPERPPFTRILRRIGPENPETYHV